MLRPLSVKAGNSIGDLNIFLNSFDVSVMALEGL